MNFHQKIRTPVGTLHVYASSSQLLGIYFNKNIKDNQKLRLKNLIYKKNSVISKLDKQLKEYFRGKRKNFKLPLKIEGSEFDQRAWKALNKIPYGQTISYQRQCSQMKSHAIRAMGSANGRNRFPIVIPCHRVIRSNGTLGGYSGGLKVKKKLLGLESIV